MAYFEKKGYKVNNEKNTYHNESLSDMVKNINVKERFIEYNGKLIQQVNPIFQDPSPGTYRTAFFVPEKNLFGITISTYLFDLTIIWVMAFLCYIALYFEWMRKSVEFFGNFSIPDKVNIPFRRK
jgi:hypothetical protein